MELNIRLSADLRNKYKIIYEIFPTQVSYQDTLFLKK